MVAEMELGFIRDRQRAGIDAAKAKEIYKAVTFDPRPSSPARKRDGRDGNRQGRRCKGGNVYKALKAAGLN
jgi:DNA invertase Pin-like site-specific DNA recombinase